MDINILLKHNWFVLLKVNNNNNVKLIIAIIILF